MDLNTHIVIHSRMKLRIVAADNNPIVLEKLVSILKIEFDVVKIAIDGKSSLDIILNYRPDVAVLDLEMPGLNGLEIARELMKINPRPAIVICSVEHDLDVVDAALKAGALGYVFKARAARDLNTAVKSAARGQSFVSKD
jgi:two-component system nitrate/nitrite response regulator NarL